MVNFSSDTRDEEGDGEYDDEKTFGLRYTINLYNWAHIYITKSSSLFIILFVAI